MSGPLPADFAVQWRNSSGLQYKNLKVRSTGIKASSTLYKEDNIPAFTRTVRIPACLLRMRTARHGCLVLDAVLQHRQVAARARARHVRSSPAVQQQRGAGSQQLVAMLCVPDVIGPPATNASHARITFSSDRLVLSHKQSAESGETRLQVDVSGGFYEDGPWGPIKLTKSNALSTSILAWTLLDAEDAMRKEEPTLVRR